MAEVVSLNIQGAKAFLQIERPDALNALNGDVLQALDNRITELQSRNDVGVVIVSGAGEKAFVAGADIKFMQKLSAPEAQEFSRRGSGIFSRLESLPQIVIARVQGFALGGGLELALATDFIIASNKARFGLPEVSLGLIPGFGGTQRLTRKIGVSKALEWMTTAEKYTAEQAQAAGLVNHVVSPEELVSFTDKIADTILRNGPEAVKRAKFVAQKGMECGIDAAFQLESGYFGLCFGTAEAAEGIGAFVEKRQAKFR